MPVPDPNTRVAGALTGQFDYVDNLSVEAFPRIDASKTARPVMLKPYGWPVLAMNTKQGTPREHGAAPRHPGGTQPR